MRLNTTWLSLPPAAYSSDMQHHLSDCDVYQIPSVRFSKTVAPSSPGAWYLRSESSYPASESRLPAPRMRHDRQPLPGSLQAHQDGPEALQTALASGSELEESEEDS